VVPPAAGALVGALPTLAAGACAPLHAATNVMPTVPATPARNPRLESPTVFDMGSPLLRQRTSGSESRIAVRFGWGAGTFGSVDDRGWRSVATCDSARRRGTRQPPYRPGLS